MDFAALRPQSIDVTQAAPVRLPSGIAAADGHYLAGPEAPLVILVQDAHTNPSAQINIARALDRLLADRPVSTVYLEAGKGDLSLADLREAPLDKRRSVGLSYLKKGLLQGSEYAQLTGDREFMLWGVENRALYERSLRVYRSVARSRQKALAALKKIQSAYVAVRGERFGPELADWDERMRRFADGEVPIIEHVADVQRMLDRLDAGKNIHPKLKSLTKLHEKEKAIRYDLVDQGMRVLTQAALQAATDPADRLLLEEMSGGRLNAGPEGESRADTVCDLLLAVRQNIPDGGSGHFEAVRAAVEHLKLRVRVRSVADAELFDELRAAETFIASRLAVTEPERRLLEIGGALRDWRAAIELQSDASASARLASAPARLQPAGLIGYLNRQILDLDRFYEKVPMIDPAFERALGEARQFYALAARRDRVFWGLMRRRMEAEGEHEAVLIVGGYHAENLKRLFRSEGVSYVSFVPCVTHETDPGRYERILLDRGRSAISPLPSRAPGSPVGGRLEKELGDPAVRMAATSAYLRDEVHRWGVDPDWETRSWVSPTASIDWKSSVPDGAKKRLIDILTDPNQTPIPFPILVRSVEIRHEKHNIDREVASIKSDLHREFEGDLMGAAKTRLYDRLAEFGYAKQGLEKHQKNQLIAMLAERIARRRQLDRVDKDGDHRYQVKIRLPEEREVEFGIRFDGQGKAVQVIDVGGRAGNSGVRGIVQLASTDEAGKAELGTLFALLSKIRDASLQIKTATSGPGRPDASVIGYFGQYWRLAHEPFQMRLSKKSGHSADYRLIHAELTALLDLVQSRFGAAQRESSRDQVSSNLKFSHAAARQFQATIDRHLADITAVRMADIEAVRAAASDLLADLTPDHADLLLQRIRETVGSGRLERFEQIRLAKIDARGDFSDRVVLEESLGPDGKLIEFSGKMPRLVRNGYPALIRDNAQKNGLEYAPKILTVEAAGMPHYLRAKIREEMNEAVEAAELAEDPEERLLNELADLAEVTMELKKLLVQLQAGGSSGQELKPNAAAIGLTAELPHGDESVRRADVEKVRTFAEEYFFGVLDRRFVRGGAEDLRELPVRIDALLEAAGTDRVALMAKRGRLKSLLSRSAVEPEKIGYEDMVYLTEVLNQEVLIPNGSIMLFTEAVGGGFVAAAGRITRDQNVHIDLGSAADQVLQVPVHDVDLIRRSVSGGEFRFGAFYTRFRIYLFNDVLRKEFEGGIEMMGLAMAVTSGTDRVQRQMGRLGLGSGTDMDQGFSKEEREAHRTQILPLLSDDRKRAGLFEEMRRSMVVHEAAHWAVAYLRDGIVDFLDVMESGEVRVASQEGVTGGGGVEAAKEAYLHFTSKILTAGSRLRRQMPGTTASFEDIRSFVSVVEETLADLTMMRSARYPFVPMFQNLRRAVVSRKAALDAIAHTSYADSSSFILDRFVETLRPPRLPQTDEAGMRLRAYNKAVTNPDKVRGAAGTALSEEFVGMKDFKIGIYDAAAGSSIRAGTAVRMAANGHDNAVRAYLNQAFPLGDLGIKFMIVQELAASGQIGGVPDAGIEQIAGKIQDWQKMSLPDLIGEAGRLISDGATAPYVGLDTRTLVSQMGEELRLAGRGTRSLQQPGAIPHRRLIAHMARVLALKRIDPRADSSAQPASPAQATPAWSALQASFDRVVIEYRRRVQARLLPEDGEDLNPLIAGQIARILAKSFYGRISPSGIDWGPADDLIGRILVARRGWRGLDETVGQSRSRLIDIAGQLAEGPGAPYAPKSHAAEAANIFDNYASSHKNAPLDKRWEPMTSLTKTRLINAMTVMYAAYLSRSIDGVDPARIERGILRKRPVLWNVEGDRLRIGALERRLRRVSAAFAFVHHADIRLVLRRSGSAGATPGSVKVADLGVIEIDAVHTLHGGVPEGFAATEDLLNDPLYLHRIWLMIVDAVGSRESLTFDQFRRLINTAEDGSTGFVVELGPGIRREVRIRPRQVIWISDPSDVSNKKEAFSPDMIAYDQEAHAGHTEATVLGLKQHFFASYRRLARAAGEWNDGRAFKGIYIDSGVTPAMLHAWAASGFTSNDIAWRNNGGTLDLFPGGSRMTDSGWDPGMIKHPFLKARAQRSMQVLGELFGSSIPDEWQHRLSELQTRTADPEQVKASAAELMREWSRLAVDAIGRYGHREDDPKGASWLVVLGEEDRPIALRDEKGEVGDSTAAAKQIRSSLPAEALRTGSGEDRKDGLPEEKKFDVRGFSGPGTGEKFTKGSISLVYPRSEATTKTADLTEEGRVARNAGDANATEAVDDYGHSDQLNLAQSPAEVAYQLSLFYHEMQKALRAAAAVETAAAKTEADAAQLAAKVVEAQPALSIQMAQAGGVATAFERMDGTLVWLTLERMPDGKVIFKIGRDGVPHALNPMDGSAPADQGRPVTIDDLTKEEWVFLQKRVMSLSVRKLNIKESRRPGDPSVVVLRLIGLLGNDGLTEMRIRSLAAMAARTGRQTAFVLDVGRSPNAWSLGLKQRFREAFEAERTQLSARRTLRQVDIYDDVAAITGTPYASAVPTYFLSQTDRLSISSDPGFPKDKPFRSVVIEDVAEKGGRYPVTLYGPALSISVELSAQPEVLDASDPNLQAIHGFHTDLMGDEANELTLEEYIRFQEGDVSLVLRVVIPSIARVSVSMAVRLLETAARMTERSA